MALTLLEQAQLANNGEFLSRISMAMYIAARDVSNEAVTPGYESYHQKRLALAQLVMQSPGGMSSQFAYGSVANPVITAQSPDGDLQFTVNSLWDSLAGVDPSERPPA